MSAWRIIYLPSGEPLSGTELVHEGTEESLAAYFLEHCVCALCKREMREGSPIHLGGESNGDSVEEEVLPPYENVWATACACEWYVEEIGVTGPTLRNG